MFQSIFSIWTKIHIFLKISWLNREKIFLLALIMYQDNGFNFFEIRVCSSYHTCSIWSDFLAPKCIYFRFEENSSVLVVTMVFISQFYKKERQLQKKRSLICLQVFSLVQTLPGKCLQDVKLCDCVFYITVYTFVKYGGWIERKVILIMIIYQDGDFFEIGLIYHTKSYFFLKKQSQFEWNNSVYILTMVSIFSLLKSIGGFKKKCRHLIYNINLI